MNISRRHLTGPLPVFGLLAVGLLGAKAAQAMTADEEGVAKRLEAFRAASPRTMQRLSMGSARQS